MSSLDFLPSKHFPVKYDNQTDEAQYENLLERHTTTVYIESKSDHAVITVLAHHASDELYNERTMRRLIED